MLATSEDAFLEIRRRVEAEGAAHGDVRDMKTMWIMGLTDPDGFYLEVIWRKPGFPDSEHSADRTGPPSIWADLGRTKEPMPALELVHAPLVLIPRSFRKPNPLRALLLLMGGSHAEAGAGCPARAAR